VRRLLELELELLREVVRAGGRNPFGSAGNPPGPVG
jgi:hypothetical protein